MKKKILLFLMVLCATISVSAQIGYQVTVYDETKKEPKVNQPVQATVTITDTIGKVICTENFNGTTDEFGILSMQVGNASTFSDVDWSKTPLWISATVDGVTLSKTQILSVPIAEHTNHYGTLSPSILCSKTWKYQRSEESYSHTRTIKFKTDGSMTLTATYKYYSDGTTYTTSYSFNWYIIGDQVFCLNNVSGSEFGDPILLYIPQKNYLCLGSNLYK